MRFEEKAVGPVNDAAKLFAAGALPILLAFLYVGVTVLTATDRELLLGHLLELPLIGREVPIWQFFVYTPVMVVGLHLLLLVPLLLLVNRIRRLPRYAACRSQLIPIVSVQAFNPLGQSRGMLLLQRGQLVLLLGVVPLALLAAIEITFLPYRDRTATLVQLAAAVVSASLCLYFLPGIFSEDGRARSWWSDPARLEPRALGIATALYLLLVGLAPVVPGSWHHLDVSHQVLGVAPALGCDPGDVDCICSQEPAAGGIPPGLRLSGRDLRNADLSGSVLVGADLRGADLRDADLSTAVLCHADLSPAGLRDLERARGEPGRVRFGDVDPAEVVVTRLADADLAGADLRHARLAMADLRVADLTGAFLEHNDLFRADLRGARLPGARLDDADLTRATLDGADLERATAARMRLRGASARGLRGRRIGAEGADLGGADLRGGSFVGAGFKDADFTGARLHGADLRSSTLTGAVNLSLRVVDLRGADVIGATALACCEKEPYLVDARGVAVPPPPAPGDPAPPAPAERAPIQPLAALLACPDGLRGRVPRPSCTSPERTEAVFHAAQVESMISEACRDTALAAALVARAWGCVAPREPLLEAVLRRELSDPGSGGADCAAIGQALAAASLRSAGRSEPPAWLAQRRFVRWDRSLSRARCLELESELDQSIAGLRSR